MLTFLMTLAAPELAAVPRQAGGDQGDPALSA